MPFDRSGAWLLLFSAALAVCAAGDQPEAVQLTRFQEKVRQDLAQVPSYTCLETIKREDRRSASHTFAPVDTVRIEVSSVGGKEIYAWPGARQFEDKDLTAFIARGASAAGLFVSVMPNDLFVDRKGSLEYRGDEDLDGRRAVRYDYRIPQFSSGLKLHIGDVLAVVASKGSFWFDPTSADLIRLDTYGDDMPATLDLREAMLSVRYARARIGNADALLPQQGEMTLTHFSGAASRNTIEFAQCRAYQTESSISFEEPPAPGLPQPGVHEVRLPAGLLVPVILETAIDSATVALGDPLRARVRQDVRRDGKVAIPAGAVVSGRIRRLERSTAGIPYFVVGVELFEVTWENTRADFYGELVEGDVKKGMTAGFGTRGSVTYILQGKGFHIAPGLGLLWRVLDRPRDPG
jgi:hypothetical protein